MGCGSSTPEPAATHPPRPALGPGPGPQNGYGGQPYPGANNGPGWPAPPMPPAPQPYTQPPEKQYEQPYPQPPVARASPVPGQAAATPPPYTPQSMGHGNVVTPESAMAAAPPPQHEEPAYDPIHAVGGPTQALGKLSEAVMQGQTADGTFEKLKKLGQGGFGTVWLCKRTTAARSDKRQMPEYFAMKELSSNKLFHPGRDKNLKDYLPLNEPSIQQYMKHEAIVETYWADVRCLDPKTGRPLEIGAQDLNTWTSLDKLADIEVTVADVAGTRQRPANMPEAVKLQMRIAMEHCDLGSLKDYLVDPAKPPTKPLAQEISWPRGSRINKTRCALLTALDIAEALKFMHKSTTLHGDLKPHNILLVSDKRDEKLFRAKISDFGLSAHMTAGQTSVSISQGTEAYLPKEVFQTLAVTEASDIYALGLLMWEIFYGIFWFIVWDTEKRRKNVRLPQHMDGYRPSCSPSCPKDFASIIHDCLSSNPDNRPSAGDVVARLINVIGQTPAEVEHS